MQIDEPNILVANNDPVAVNQKKKNRSEFDCMEFNYMHHRSRQFDFQKKNWINFAISEFYNFAIVQFTFGFNWVHY